MPLLYINNYRGFDETFMKLKKVNFFVGENSTGKTSILKLLKVISSSQFWYNSEFNTEEAELGYFNEIITKGSIDSKSFQIGLLNETKDGSIIALKLNIIEKDAQPYIDNIRLINGQIDIEAKRYGKTIKYRYANIETEISENDSSIDYFKKWTSTNYLKNKSFKIPDKEKLFIFEEASIFLQTMLIMNTVNDRSLSFLSPDYINFLNDLTWVAPIRTEPKRTYDSYKTSYNPDGTHSPYLLKNLLTKKKGSKVRNRAENILKKFGQDSGLFNEIKINSLGNSSTSPFEVQIYLNEIPLKITNVGYGVSQVLPLIVEVINSSTNSWFAIQQPEIHLHPKAQAAFGDFLHKSTTEDEMNFIIETHSDYTIDRFRLKLSESNFKNSPPKSQVVFFNRNIKGNQLTCIDILENGKYDDKMPKEFKEFFIREQINLLSI